VRPLLFLLAVASLAACDSGGEAQPEPAPRPPPPPEITTAELGEHLEALQRIAGENGGTRAAGTPGYAASAEYVAARLREARWRVELQRLRFPYFELRSARVLANGRRLRRAQDFQVLSHSGSGRAGGALRPVGDGCSSSGFPTLAPDELPVAARGGCFFHEKATNAQRAGARALVIVDYARTRRGLPSATLGVPGVRIPVVLVSARALGPATTGTRVRVEVDAVSERRVTHNVIAETPGGRGDRVAMAGGHLDSVAGGPGINDNGSGVAALIEAAEAIGPEPPGARVRLGFWAAEELGLHGSRHYVRSLGRDERRRIRAYLNFDMVGSPNAVPELYGDGDASLARVLRRATNADLGETVAGGSSDHAPFQEAGIRVNGLYTGTTERGRMGRARDPCYHLACDTIANVDRRVLLRMARAAARAIRGTSQAGDSRK
jgi:Zn-dependent M28 family amino/carboxypeptidase